MEAKRLYVVGGVAAVVGVGLYFWRKRSKHLNDLGKFCAQFKSGNDWLTGRCYVDPERAQGDVRNLRSVGYETRVTEE